MTLKRLLTALGILALTVTTCHARDCRETRAGDGNRYRTSERSTNPTNVKRAAERASAGPLATRRYIPTAIDSESGELYFVEVPKDAKLDWIWGRTPAQDRASVTA